MGEELLHCWSHASDDSGQADNVSLIFYQCYIMHARRLNEKKVDPQCTRHLEGASHPTVTGDVA